MRWNAAAWLAAWHTNYRVVTEEILWSFASQFAQGIIYVLNSLGTEDVLSSDLHIYHSGVDVIVQLKWSKLGFESMATHYHFYYVHLLITNMNVIGRRDTIPHQNILGNKVKRANSYILIVFRNVRSIYYNYNCTISYNHEFC